MDWTTTLLANFGNLLSHIDVFKTHNHLHSCLLCSSSERPKYVGLKGLYPVATTTDLELLKTENNTKRLLIGHDPLLFRYLESYLAYEHEKCHWLSYSTIVCVDLFPLEQFKTKKFILIVSKDTEYMYNDQWIVIEYIHRENTIKSIIHALFVTKSKLRIQDLFLFVSSNDAHIMIPDSMDTQTCLFL